MKMSSEGNTPTDHGVRMPRSGRGRNNITDKASQVAIMRNPCNDNHKRKNNNDKNRNELNVGSWNVNTMLRPTKLVEIKNIMNKAGLDILGLCETRWAGNGDYRSDGFRIIHSGKEKSGSNGVAVVLNSKWSNNVLNTYHD